MKKVLLALFIFVQSFILLAQKKQYPEIDIPYKKYVLDNGLTLIVHEDHKAPIAAFNVWYHVGSKNEKQGKTGFAHLFEHLMFNGSKHYNKDFFKLTDAFGATDLNGTTNNDRTNYFENFPIAALDKILWVESDRMGFMVDVIDTARVIEQRGVVQNEKRLGENQPYGVADELSTKAVYPVGHPYSWTVIGSMEDLNAASVNDVKDWFKKYYGPNNAVIVIAGDVNPDEIFEKVKKYFGDIPAGPPLARYTSWPAKMTGTKYQVVQDRVPQPRIIKMWNVPGWGTKEVTYLKILSDVLSTGKSSRLYKRLVYDEQLASNVSCFAWDNEIGGNFYIQADAKPGADLTKIDRIIGEELQKVFKENVTLIELERAKTNYFAGFIKSMERIGGFGGKSDMLAECATYGGSADYYKKVQSWIKTATPEDIKSVATQWLSDGEYQLHILPYGTFSNTASNLNRDEEPPMGKSNEAKFPEIKELKLSNGLKVYFAERHSVPSVVMNLIINAGAAADQFGMPGTAKLASKMTTEGTLTKTSLQISDLLNDLGADLYSSTSLDVTNINLKALKTNLDASVNLFADVLLNPSFPQKDFERVQKEQILLIKQEQASPFSMAQRIMPSLLFGKGHAYSNPMSGTGTEESVQKITRDELVKFHKTWYTPNNSSLVVVGDVTEAELKLLLEKNLALWKPQEVPVKNLSAVPLAPQSTVYIIDKPNALQSTIYACEVYPYLENKDNEATLIMDKILGGSFTSRINMNLREDKHWAYGAFSWPMQTKGQGIFMASSDVQTDKTKESMSEFQKELTQVNSTKPITDAEFKVEQNNTVLSLGGIWETNNSVMYFLSNTVIYNRGLDYPSQYPALVKSLTLNDIQKAAEKIVKPSNLTWVIVGDRVKIEKGIKELNFGPVKFLDVNANEIK